MKLIISKAILKRSNLETIEKNLKEINVNLKKESNPYQYNMVDNFQ